MSDRTVDELWDAAIEETGRWGRRYLYHRGRHCAMGILGFVKFGEEFDAIARDWEVSVGGRDGQDPYAMVAEDPELGPMVQALAATIREQHPNAGDLDHYHPHDYYVVIEYNDTLAKKGADLKAMMEKARNR